MKIFLVCDPKLYTRCARFAHVGTWTAGKLCRKCEQPTSKLVEPLQIEWEPDSDCICDFSWSGYIAAVKTRIGETLQTNGVECHLGSVTYVEPKRKSGRHIVSYPYVGPPLSWLIPTRRIPLDEERSGVDLVVDCDECGQAKYTFKTQGVVIDRNRWNGELLFHIEQFGRSRAVFGTEEAIQILEEQEISNVDFVDAGVIA